MAGNLSISFHGEESWFPEETVIYRIQVILVPILSITGIVGNLLTVWVLSVSQLRGLSSSFYLTSLTLSDSGFLLSLFFVWLKEVGVDIYNREVWCQLLTYLSHVTTFLSVWLVVAFTSERFIAVGFPLLRVSVCTPRRAKIVVSGLVLVSVTLYSYLLVAAGTMPIDNIRYCTLKTSYESVAHVMNQVDLIMTLLVPLVLIIVLNVKIVRCVKFIEKLRPELSVANLNNNQFSQVKMTKSLVIISTVFVVLNLPSYFIRAYSFFAVSIAQIQLYLIL